MLGISPQDEYGLFDAPVSSIILGTGAVKIAVLPDPTRVLLVMSGDGTGQFYVLPTGSGADPANGQGINLGVSQPTLTLDYTMYGPLCQAGWSVFSQVGSHLAVVTVSLRRDPAVSGFAGAFIRPAAANYRPPVPTAAKRPRPPLPGRIPPAVLAALGRRCPRLLGGQL